MSISVDKYIDGVLSIYIEQPKYKLGCDGSNGYCDCIGMCKGAIRRAGGNPSGLSGTNYAARHTIKNLKKISSVKELSIGDVVLKGRQPGSSGYDLPDQYKSGSDLTDYYHIGTVTGVNPLQITHMTSPTAKQDNKLGNWNYFGQLPQVSKDEPAPEPEPIPEPTPEPTPEVETAVVVAEKGNTVNMRKSPSISAPLVERIRIGETVTVLVHGEDWCQVKWKWYTGWMMTRFLLFENDMPIEEDYTVTIVGLTKEQAEMLKREFGADMVTISVG